MTNNNKPFSGTTEIRLTLEAKKRTNISAKHTTTKQVVLGMVNRETGEVKAIKVSSVEKSTLLPKDSFKCKRWKHYYN